MLKNQKTIILFDYNEEEKGNEFENKMIIVILLRALDVSLIRKLSEHVHQKLNNKLQ